MRIIINPKYIRIFAKPKCPTMLRPMTYLLPSFSHPSFTDEESSCEAFGRRFCESKSSEHYGFFLGLNFTGKETDCETGFSYFGARYYDPTLLTGWTAVDPMADKYPSLSPYNYCAWNPMKLVDPDGRDAVEEDDFPPIFDFFRSAAKKRERFIKKNPDWKAVCNGIIDNEGRTTFYARNHTTGSVEENSDFGEGGVNLPAVNITEKQFTDGDGYHFLHHTLRRFDNSLVGSNDAALESRLDRNEIEAGLKVVSYMTFAGASIESICAKKGLQIAGNLLGLGSSLMGELDNEHRDFFNIINMGLSTYGLLSTSGPANVINDCVTLGSSTYNISNSKEQKSTHHNDN